MPRGSHFLVLLLLLFLTACQEENPYDQPLVIAASASMKFPVEQIARQFEEAFNAKVEIVVSSSGKLTAQIRQGAPFHGFVSADRKYPESLLQDSLAMELRAYAWGRLALWTGSESILTLSDLAREEVKHIAIANPDIAPFGAAALETLKAAGVYDQIADKLVYGESIVQVNQFISTGAVDAAITAQSAIYLPTLQELGNWQLVDSKLYAPIEQAHVIVIHDTEWEGRARAFFDFFQSHGTAILNSFGYKLRN